MERDGNESQPAPPRRLPDRAARGNPPAPASDDVMRWVAAGVVSAAALLGLLVLVAIVAYVLQPPGWVQTILGIAMAAGAATFAWLLASALRKDDGARDDRRR